MKKLKLRIYIISGVLALLALACFIVFRSLSGTLQSQKAAERWAGEGNLSFAQLTCFLNRDDSLSLGDVYSFRQDLSARLSESDLEMPENGSLFADAWSAFGTLNVAGDHGSGDAEVTAVGGNFFLFHPLRLLSGSYITEDDVTDDRVVLDRELAWRLFGGTELEGMTVTIGGQPFVVAGVVEREQDFASKKARDEGMGMYMSYRAYDRMAAGDAADVSAFQPIECYELVMPQPVDGYAEGIFTELFKDNSGETVNNSGRFSVNSVWQIVKDFGTRSMHRTSVIYPWWENAARCVGDWCAMFLALAALFAICPTVTLLVTVLVLLIRLKDYLAKKIPAASSEAVERRRKKRYRGLHER